MLCRSTCFEKISLSSIYIAQTNTIFCFDSMLLVHWWRQGENKAKTKRKFTHSYIVSKKLKKQLLFNCSPRLMIILKKKVAHCVVVNKYTREKFTP